MRIAFNTEGNGLLESGEGIAALQSNALNVSYNVEWLRHNLGRRFTLVVWAAALLGVSLLAGIALYLGVWRVDIFPRARALDSALAKYRKAGLPWTAADLARNPPVPERDNADELIERAISEFSVDQFREESTALEAQAISGDDKGLEMALTPFRQSLEFAAQAAQKPSLDFHRDWDQGPTIIFPEYTKIRWFCKAFVWRAEAEASNRPGLACTDLETAWRLAELSGQEPAFASILVSIGIQFDVLHAYQFCVAKINGEASNIANLEASLTPGPLPSFDYALKGEAYMGVSLIRNLDRYGGLERIKALSSGAIALRPVGTIIRNGDPRDLFAQAYMDRHLEFWTALARFSGGFGMVNPSFEIRAGDLIEALRSETSMSAALELLVLPEFPKMDELTRRLKATIESTTALLKAMEIKAKTGHFPSRIEDIPGNWTDPFTNKPLKLELVGSGIRIYSVGSGEQENVGLRRGDIPGFGINDDLVAAYPPLSKGRSRLPLQ